jgi:hypothetical protein
MRYDSRVDENQSGLIQAARDMGASVLLLHRVGMGCPDLLLFYHGQYMLVEVKSPGGVLNERQRDWIAHWPGPVKVVHSSHEMISLLLSMG